MVAPQGALTLTVSDDPCVGDSGCTLKQDEYRDLFLQLGSTNDKLLFSIKVFREPGSLYETDEDVLPPMFVYIRLGSQPVVVPFSNSSIFDRLLEVSNSTGNTTTYELSKNEIKAGTFFSVS